MHSRKKRKDIYVFTVADFNKCIKFANIKYKQASLGYIYCYSKITVFDKLIDKLSTLKNLTALVRPRKKHDINAPALIKFFDRIY